MKRYKLKSLRGSSSTLNYDRDLNEGQRAVVLAGSGPLLVIAGAGTGKTHTLTYRMAHLVERGVAPGRILLLTFTNRAARAMTQRAATLLNIDASVLAGGTFHSMANRFLRRYADHLGYPSAYTIIDGEDAATLMKSCIAEADVGHLERRFPKGGLIRNLASFSLNTGQTIEAVLEEKYPYFQHLYEELRQVIGLYHIRKKEMGLMDFDDLLINWWRLLTENEEVRDALAKQFDYLLVDEYQDTNHIQGEIVDLMAAAHQNIMVVGDDCQSIYAFRGADYQNILQFPQRYEECQQFRLEKNYRSTPEILELANQSIRFNTGQFQKTLQAHRSTGPLPAHVHLPDANIQASFVCQRILELVDEGVELKDMAVLYRSHHQSLELQLEMTRCEIPFVIRSGLRFFEQAHIKDVLSYLRFLFNPRDELSFLRLVLQWRGIGQKRAGDIWLFLHSHADPLEGIQDPRLAEMLPGRARQSMGKLASLIATLRSLRLGAGPEELLFTLLDSEFQDHIQGSYENSENRLNDLEQLATYSAQFGSIDEFLGEISLLSTLSGQEIGVGTRETDNEYVTLSSVHQAKGLEWNVLFVLHLAHGEFPHHRASEEADGLEEERRLFYVAVTRARDELYLCHPLTKRTRDQIPVVLRESAFIEELRESASMENQRLPFEDWRIEF